MLIARFAGVICVAPASAQILNWGAEVGVVSSSGSSSYDATTQSYIVSGAGTGSSGTADAFHFTYYQTVAGDGQIVARLSSADATAGAALVIRSSLDPGAVSAAVVVSNTDTHFVRRPVSGADSTTSGVNGTGAPCWLKLVRRGSNISGFVSPDGQTWTSLGGDTLDLGNTGFYAGLAVSNGIANATTTATATFNALHSTFVPVSGLQLWLKAEAGLTQDASGLISVWADQSGGGHDVSQTDAGHQPSAAGAASVPNNGLPAVHFDGNGKYLQVPDIVSSATAGELFVVLRATDVTQRHSFMNFSTNYVGLSIYPFTDGHIYESFGSTTFRDIGIPVTPVTSFHLYNAVSTPSEWTSRLNGQLQFTTPSNTVGFPAAPTIGFSDGYANTYFAGDIAEILVYNRALNQAERTSVEAYLNGRYGFNSVPAAPGTLTVTPLSATQVAVSWTESTQNVTGYTVERQNADRSWSIIASPGAGSTSYVDSGLLPNTQYTYRVTAGNGQGLSPTSAAASGTTGADGGVSLSLNGLQFWLRADAGITAGADGAVSTWADVLSGHTASQANAVSKPSLVNADLHGLPAVRFDGNASYLDSDFAGIGGQEATFFVVTKGTQYQSLLSFQPSGNSNW